MATSRTRATERYRKKIGIVTKSFKLKRELCDSFAAACERAGISQTQAVTKFMQDFIQAHPAQAEEAEPDTQPTVRTEQEEMPQA